MEVYEEVDTRNCGSVYRHLDDSDDDVPPVFVDTTSVALPTTLPEPLPLLKSSMRLPDLSPKSNEVKKSNKNLQKDRNAHHRHTALPLSSKKRGRRRSSNRKSPSSSFDLASIRLLAVGVLEEGRSHHVFGDEGDEFFNSHEELAATDKTTTTPPPAKCLSDYNNVDDDDSVSSSFSKSSSCTSSSSLDNEPTYLHNNNITINAQLSPTPRRSMKLSLTELHPNEKRKVQRDHFSTNLCVEPVLGHLALGKRPQFVLPFSPVKNSTLLDDDFSDEDDTDSSKCTHRHD